MSLTTKILRDKNQNQEIIQQITTKTLKTKSFDLVSTETQDATILASKQYQQDLNEIWSQTAIKYLYDVLKFDASGATHNLFENVHISSSNLQYNCTHVNKHGVVTNANNKFEDLPSWVMQAMTTLVHWSDFKRDADLEGSTIISSKSKAHPSFRDVYNEVNIYFLDHKEPLLTKQISQLFIKILRIFLQNTKQFDIDDFMKNLKEHLNSQTRHNDLNFIDNEMIDVMNDNCCGTDHNNDICCAQCQSTLDFVNNWLNCNEIEFNEFVLSLNANYKASEQHNYEATEEKKCKISYSSTSEELSTLASDNDRKLRRNNSFIAAITDNNNTSSSSSNSTTITNKNATGQKQMVKTNSLDQINDENKKAVAVKDDLSTIQKQSINIPKRTPSFNDSQKIKNILVNSISLNNIAQIQLPTKYNKISVGALSSLISSVSLKDLNNAGVNSGDSFTLGFDYETFKQISKAFRICALCLPPINKRKLHLLLRLLYKLKFSEHAKLLVKNEYDDMDYEMEYDIADVESMVSHLVNISGG